MLLIIQTHPTQYHSPLYRVIHQKFAVPLKVVYASDFSVAGYEDKEFKSSFAWKGLLDGYPHHFLETVAGGGVGNFDQISTKGIAKLTRKLNPSVMMLTGYAPLWHQKVFWKTLFCSCKRIFRSEVTDRTEKPAMALKKAVKDIYLRWFYKNFDRLLYIGESARSHYLRLGAPQNKLIFSPYSIDSSIVRSQDLMNQDLRKQLRESHKILDTDYVLLFSGKYIQRKGGDLLIQAVKDLPDSLRAKVRIIFLGAGPLEQKWKEMAGTDLGKRCIFTGFKNQNEISPFFLMADLFVLPSRYETWGLVVNEALAHGLPGIVSDSAGCVTDLVKQGITGWIFQSGNARDLCNKIIQALPQCRSGDIRRNCLEKAMEYSLEKSAEGIARAYYELTKAKS